MALTFGGDPKLNARAKTEAKAREKAKRHFRQKIRGGALKNDPKLKAKAKAERYRRRAKARSKGRTTTRKKG